MTYKPSYKNLFITVGETFVDDVFLHILACHLIKETEQ